MPDPPRRLVNDPHTPDRRNLSGHNIELSSAADHAQSSKFLTGKDPGFRTTSKATAPTICYDYSRLESALSVRVRVIELPATEPGTARAWTAMELRGYLGTLLS